MKIEFIDRDGYKSSARLQKIVKEKLEKLSKYFDEDVKVRVVCRKIAKQEKLEITLAVKGALYRSEVVSDSMYNNIDIALPKLEKQIVRYVEKKNDKKKSRKSLKDLPEVMPFEFIEEEPEELPAVFKKKTFNLDPMLIDDARYAIERLGHSFYVFLNAKTGRVNVLYKREDGLFGLIDVKY